MPEHIRRARLYAGKWRIFERNSLPWNRLAIHREFMAREAYVRWPVQGNVLKALRSGWMTIGEGVHLEPHVWISVMGGRLMVGPHTALNHGVMVSVVDHVEIGGHCMFANGCFITDANHRFGDLSRPVRYQGLESKGPTLIGDSVWCGANVVVTGGVTIGERCVVGANSVVTHDLPARTICAGVPARPIKPIRYDDPMRVDAA